MMISRIPGLGTADGFTDLKAGGSGLYQVGQEGVVRILTPADKKIELIVYNEKTLVYVKSALGYPAIYPLQDAAFEGPAEAVLMDLDGTSVHSETFWMWVIEQSMARLLGNQKFTLEAADEPHVSGHSVSEHLKYCIDKYCPGMSLEAARNHYYEITDYEMREIMEGRGRQDAFTPSPGLRDFLLELKANHVKIGLVTSGLYEKAWPEIASAFRTLKLGDPLDFYDTIITAGQALKKGQAGTLGELSPKPHPWLYAEAAAVGLGIGTERRRKVIGLEDSSAGIVSIRLAGFAAVGVAGGNIAASGMGSFLYSQQENLCQCLDLILNR